MQQSRLDDRSGFSGPDTRPMPAPFRVLVTCTYFEPGFRGGGPGRSVAHILDAASPATAPTLVTRDRDLGDVRSYPGLSGRWHARGRVPVFYLSLRSPRQWLALWRELRRTRFDLLYVNSLWAPMSVFPIVAVSCGLLRADRVLVAPRGECSSGALSLRSARKRLFVAGWRRVLRRLDASFHASTEREAADIRRLFPWAAVQINANQSPLPPEPASVPSPAPGPLRLVFVGRVAAMKNLALALEALAAVRLPVTLVVYGPIEDAAYWRRCEALIAVLPPTVRVRYEGMLAPSEVVEALADHDALVMPTLGENFGHVIAESLAAACPVLCSDRTPWTPVLTGGGGSVVSDLTAAAWAAEIDRWAARTPEQRHDARLAAADAYRRWRSTVARESILDVMRLRSHVSGAECVPFVE
ncbi:glycosyltransferase involved in cell wall biosynthesis [Micromonospora sp. M71_S20]|uniref:glycosyltransferase family 4 protein n=1 Tax=Micromonospora sp. M71_S20 TaxID=592872 RepID=UPI000EB3CBF9|nr:glycosyltransferase family 4 protein [Micromonospora sp. M71_S20]RLK22460.1 glycosyltransferase involved in cell wall biosynthesis [Micromonospora sp. M71_S20]